MVQFQCFTCGVSICGDIDAVMPMAVQHWGDAHGPLTNGEMDDEGEDDDA